jgi:hypothetical protein
VIKKSVAVIAVMLFLSGSAVFAGVEAKGKTMVSVNGDYGFTYPGGSASSAYSADIGTNYGFGAKVGYGIFAKGIVYCGLEYQSKELGLKGDLFGDTWDEKYTQKYVDISGAYRFLFGSMYADLGLYYGVRLGKMKWKATGDITGSETSSSNTHNDFGMLMGIGFLIPVGDSAGIDIGLKIKGGLVDVYSDDAVKIRNRTVALTAGFAKFF